MSEYRTITVGTPAAGWGFVTKSEARCADLVARLTGRLPDVVPGADYRSLPVVRVTWGRLRAPRPHLTLTRSTDEQS